MASLSLNHIFKVYPNGVKAVNDFTFDIADKEFVVFVGPSGCGKSTTLRMIAGLEEITAGELYIGDKLVNDLEPSERDIAMVFQNYALYPHMTVYENMAFGLRNRHEGKEEIDRKVRAAAEILDLTPYLDRKPKEMSGGQCQRVALGRAIVRDPKVFLLDEPLSNLDAKLRASMRTEISRLHQRLGTTFIYVTHDQVEAMTMGTRIVVMKDGFVQQIDAPVDLYNNPKNKFVAGFIGTPQMNFFPAVARREGKEFALSVLGLPEVLYPLEDHAKFETRSFGVPILVGVRPDHIHVSETETPFVVQTAIIEQLGNESILYGDLIGQGTTSPITMKIPPKKTYVPGSKLFVTFDQKELHFFSKETEDSIQQMIPSGNYVSLGENQSVFGKTLPLDENLLSSLKGKAVFAAIPLDAMEKGETYSLPLISKEEHEGKVLLGLRNGEEYVFFFAPEGIPLGEKGESISFDIDWSKVTFRTAEEVLIAPIAPTFRLPVHFEKGKDENKRFCLRYRLGEKEFALSHDDSDKLLNIDGKKALKRTYDFEIAVKDLDFSGDDFSLDIARHVTYGKRSFGIGTFLGKEIALPVNENAMTVHFSYSPNRVVVFENGTDMRLIY